MFDLVSWGQTLQIMLQPSRHVPDIVQFGFTPDMEATCNFEALVCEGNETGELIVQDLTYLFDAQEIETRYEGQVCASSLLLEPYQHLAAFKVEREVVGGERLVEEHALLSAKWPSGAPCDTLVDSYIVDESWTETPAGIEINTLELGDTLLEEKDPQVADKVEKNLPKSVQILTEFGTPNLDIALEDSASLQSATFQVEPFKSEPRPVPVSQVNVTGTVLTPAAQISVAVLDAGEGMTEIVLSPEELGRVQITLEQTNDAMIVHVVAERSETTDLIRRNLSDLTRELSDIGFENVGFNFEGEAHDDRQAKQAVFARSSKNSSTLGEPLSIPQVSDGLDLRL